MNIPEKYMRAEASNEPFYLSSAVMDREGLKEELENEKAMLERDLLDIANRQLRIASLENQLGE
jgi:hypothetical protein